MLVASGSPVKFSKINRLSGLKFREKFEVVQLFFVTSHLTLKGTLCRVMRRNFK